SGCAQTCSTALRSVTKCPLCWLDPRSSASAFPPRFPSCFLRVLEFTNIKKNLAGSRLRIGHFRFFISKNSKTKARAFEHPRDLCVSSSTPTNPPIEHFVPKQ
uniref:Uncharacterized protein n=1 Tax=Lutzomyia longipalpis TaxID=7200 RepID=A0A1B0CKQ5_LUTLO